VVINKNSYTFTNVDLTTQLHAIVVQLYSVVTLDGVQATVSTTKLKLSASAAIQNLEVGDITITNITSSERNNTVIDDISAITVGSYGATDYELSIHGN
jgi:hypothetical protein